MDLNDVRVSVKDITMILQKFSDAMQAVNSIEDQLKALAEYNEAIMNVYKQGWLAGYHQQSADAILQQLNNSQ